MDVLLGALLLRLYMLSRPALNVNSCLINIICNVDARVWSYRWQHDPGRCATDVPEAPQPGPAASLLAVNPQPLNSLVAMAPATSAPATAAPVEMLRSPLQAALLQLNPQPGSTQSLLTSIQTVGNE